MIKMVAFDLDGTICDSMLLCIEAFGKAMAPYSDKELTEKDILSTFGLNEIGMVKAVVKNNWESALNDFYDYYENLHNKCTKPFAGICELIAYLKQNKVIVPLITGKGEKCCNITLKSIGLDSMFDDIMFGSEKYRNKMENMLNIMDKYSVEKDEFFYIGDSITDIDDCHNIGVTCLSAAWDERNNPEKLKVKNPLYTFECVNQLKQFLDIEISTRQE